MLAQIYIEVLRFTHHLNFKFKGGFSALVGTCALDPST